MRCTIPLISLESPIILFESQIGTWTYFHTAYEGNRVYQLSGAPHPHFYDYNGWTQQFLSELQYNKPPNNLTFFGFCILNKDFTLLFFCICNLVPNTVLSFWASPESRMIKIINVEHGQDISVAGDRN